jgi:hypothetical protein
MTPLRHKKDISQTRFFILKIQNKILKAKNPEVKLNYRSIKSDALEVLL